jgi:hypothetical protein
MELLLPSGHVVLFDDADWPLVSQYKWQSQINRKSVYAVGRKTWRDKKVYMHRLIMGLPSGRHTVVDHIDRNGLNNSRSNLRIVTNADNIALQKRDTWKAGRLKGAYKNSRSTGLPWRSQITVNYKSVPLGYFNTEEEAAEAFRLAEKKYRNIE